MLGKAESSLDCSAKTALSWYFGICSRERMRVSLEQGHPARLILEETTPHDFKWVTVKRMPFPLTNREFVNRQLCYAQENGVLVQVRARDNHAPLRASH